MFTLWSFLPQVALPALICLFIPVGILLGARRPGSAILVMSGIAFVALALYGITISDSANANTLFTQFSSVITIFMVGGALLLLGAWALALDAAVQARQWRWLTALAVAGYATVAAFLASAELPRACPPFGGACVVISSGAQIAASVGVLICPAVIFAYGLRGRIAARPVRRSNPTGLSVSSLKVSLADAFDAALDDD